MERNELIELCKKSVVPFTKWHDRDSYSAQVNVNICYQLLKAGCKYKMEPDIAHGSYWLTFQSITDRQRETANTFYLNIDSLDDYRTEFGYEDEMFDCNEHVIDMFTYYGYIPTQYRLNEADGNDWY